MTGPDRHVAAHGQRTLLAYRAFELAFVHADEHDAGFTLSGDQIDHLDGDAGRVHAQANHQHLGHLAAAGAHRRVRGPQQREHRDRGDVVDQSLLEFGRYRRLRHEQSLRQRALLLGNRRRGRQSQRQGGYLAAVCDGQVCSSHHRPPCVRLRRQARLCALLQS